MSSILVIVGFILVLCVLGLAVPFFLSPSNSQHSLFHRPKQLVDPVFATIYGSVSPMPELKVSWSYGYPSFDITFSTKAEFEQSEIRNRDFKREIDRLFREYGTIDRPFDAEMAVFFNYPGRLNELMINARSEAKNVAPKAKASRSMV